MRVILRVVVSAGGAIFYAGVGVTQVSVSAHQSEAGSYDRHPAGAITRINLNTELW